MADRADHLGAPTYWDIRYSLERDKQLKFSSFDWYAPFELFYPTFCTVVEENEHHKVLILGIGKSTIIDVLYKRGYRDIVAIDISPTLIRQMQQKYKDFPGVEFYCIDIQRMNIFPDRTFDVVIEKACLDAIFTEIDFNQSIKRAMDEVHRVMRDEGILISISHASSASRVPYLRLVPWAIDTLPTPEGAGEGITFFVIRRTTNPKYLKNTVKGAEYVRVRTTDRVVDSFNQHMNKHSSFKSKQYAGCVTANADASDLNRLVKESAAADKVEADKALERAEITRKKFAKLL
jgi:SAM-dependent methyltransferase